MYKVKNVVILDSNIFEHKIIIFNKKIELILCFSQKKNASLPAENI